MIVTTHPPECTGTCNPMTFTATEDGAICLVCGHEFVKQKSVDSMELAQAIAIMQAANVGGNE